MRKEINFKELFQKLSEPLSCGVMHEDEVRYQKAKNKKGETEWSNERIFVLSDELHKDKPQVLFRTYYDSDNSWRGALIQYIKSERVFKHPKLKLYCIQKNLVTVRNLDFDLDIL
ncbi:hypothetical protein [Leptolyngbya phage Lbo-JY46]